MNSKHSVERREILQEPKSAGKAAHAPIVRREVVIRGVTYRLTSSFEGLKNLDATVKRLAVKHTTKPLTAAK